MRNQSLVDLPIVFAVTFVITALTDGPIALLQRISSWLLVGLAALNQFVTVNLVQHQQALWILLVIAVIAVLTVIVYELYRFFKPADLHSDTHKILTDMTHQQHALSQEYLDAVLRDLD